MQHQTPSEYSLISISPFHKKHQRIMVREHFNRIQTQLNHYHSQNIIVVSIPAEFFDIVVRSILIYHTTQGLEISPL